MDDERFLRASRLRDDGKLREALGEFVTLAGITRDSVEKASILVNVAATLVALGEYDNAMTQLRDARTVVLSSQDSPLAVSDERLLHLEVDLDFEEADIYRAQGKHEPALTKFDAMLQKYSERLKEPSFRDAFQNIQTRRAFLLADLGRCEEALAILESERFEEPSGYIEFYLGHCYLTGRDYTRAKENLVKALRVGLPEYLEYRAHCELGMVYYRMEDYPQAKVEFEKCAEKGDAGYLRQAQIWKRLEATCRRLGLKADADYYASLARPF